MNGFTLAEHILSPLKRIVGYYQGIHATIAPPGLFCRAGHCCGSQLSWLGRAFGCFSSSKACLVSSYTMKTSLRGGASGSVPAQRPLDPVSEVRGGFSNRGSPSASGG